MKSPPAVDGFTRNDHPFVHWIDSDFLARDEVLALNREWPPASDERWMHERRGYAVKSALMFPRRLPPLAHELASRLYAPEFVAALSEMVGQELAPDPWFRDGPLMPRVGGGLHEIHRGGLLGMHIDFATHPSGLTRALNLLIYLNAEWQYEWGGALELGNCEAKIYPYGGTAVAFLTTDQSWHGHPHPLTCPEGITRRSLALYYYRRDEKPSERITTLYR